MDVHERGRQPTPRRSHRTAIAALAIAIVATGPVAACTSAPAEADLWTAMPTMHGSVPTVDPGSVDVALAGAEAMWAARPDYVSSNPMAEAAYHYAINHPNIVKWMPCYCGCGGLGHESNLACYVKPDGSGFDEHASYCDICIEITLKTKDLVAQGMSLREIRQVIDETFGDGDMPSTPTAFPPA
jgi:hypothetical protein